MSASNLLGFDGKLLPSIFPAVNPYPPGAAAGLGDVLQVNNSAATPFGAIPQSITNVATLGCADIVAPFGTIQSFNSSLIQSAGGLGHLGILPVNNLTLKGCQTKGSMLVGDGTSSKELIVPVAPALPNGSVLILDSTEALGVRWGGEAGDINSITPGNNIDITGPTANPIVALKAPLTSTLNMGAVAITDSAGAVGVSGQVLTAGTGGQTLWGTNGVSSITAGLNIGVDNTIPTAPVVRLLNPLTSGLGLGTQSITGTSAGIQLINAGSTNIISSVQVRVQDTTTSTTASLLTKSSLVVNTAATNTTYSVGGMVKSGAGTLSMTQSGGAIGITSGLGVDINGGASPVSIFQPSLQATKLRTNLTNHYYYPDYYADNNNTPGPISIPYPQITNQRMTLANYGVVQNNTWDPLGDTFTSGSGCASFFEDSQGRVWTSAIGSNTIIIRDPTMLNPDLQSIAITGGSQNVAYCYYEAGGYMFVGGEFNYIDGNPQLQYNLTRFDMSSFPYNFSPIFDTSQGIEGFNNPVFAISYSSPNDQLIVGGSFTSFFPTTNTVDYLAIISVPLSAPGSQSYTTGLFGGTNGSVNALYLDTAFNYLYVGGEFTAVNAATLLYNYGAYFDFNINGWNYVGNNALNGNVMSIVITPYGAMLFAGSFTSTPQPYTCYIDRTTPDLIFPADTGLTTSSNMVYRNCVYGDGTNLAVLNAFGVYINQSYVVWIDNANPTAFGASGDTSGIELWGGDYKVGYTGSTKLYDQVILPDSCSFVGTVGIFQYLGAGYSTFTIALTDIAQQFVGNNTNGYWVPIGTPVGSFS